MSNPLNPTPTRVDPLNPQEMKIAWNDGPEFALSYLELRFRCPCASCVDEHTGQRIIQRASIRPDIRPTAVLPVGRYALQLNWNDGHSTGIYHFETIRRACETAGRKTQEP